MMVRRFGALLALGLTMGISAAGLARAEGPVVVELYTSQGCSSCPPADELLAEIAPRDDIIALALHVDYWDYIGWADTFANPAFTQRQRGYARAAGKRMIYTPQMIIAGQDHVVGHKPRDLSAAVRTHSAAHSPVSLRLERRGGGGVGIIAATRTPARMIIQMVRYTPRQSVAIGRGENAGRNIDYVNIVTSWEVIGEWTGRNDLNINATAAGSDPVVVIIQAAGHGPILAAARLR